MIINIDIAEVNMGLTKYSFSGILNVFPFVESFSVDLRKPLYFEYQILKKWICNTVCKITTEGDASDLKHLFKIVLHELKEELMSYSVSCVKLFMVICLNNFSFHNLFLFL